MGRTAIAIGSVAVGLLMACAERTTADKPSDAAAPDARTEAALEFESPDAGPCAAAGGQCELAIHCSASAPQDCGPGEVCCLDVNCSSNDSQVLVQASDYDTSCTVDSDCVAVEGFGDVCILCDCPRATINKASEPQYNADLGKVPPPHGPACFCTTPPLGPCCVGGVCQVGGLCDRSVRVGDASADTGADAAADADAE